MRFSFLPTFRTEAVTDLTPHFLQENHIRLLLLDFDNTIIPYTTNTPTPEVQAWLDAVKAAAVKLCVVSNSRKSRVKDFCKKYGLDCVTDAKKPFSKGIRQSLARYQLPADQCALVGDQIYTDTLGANCAGIRSILVRSIHNHTFWLKLRHIAEKPFIFAARNRRIKK